MELFLDDIEKFRDRYSLGRDRGEGSTNFLRIKVLGGMLTSDQLKGIARLSLKYGRGYAEITTRQDIQLHWIDPNRGIEVFNDLEELGFTTDKCGQGYPGTRYGDVRNLVSCPVAGLDRNELIDIVPIVKKINGFFLGKREYQDLPRKFKMSISGCGKNCVRFMVHDLSFVAVKNDEDVGFTALVGGSLGPSLPGPVLAKPLNVFIRPEDVLSVAKTMVEIFNEHGNREIKPKARFKWLVDDWGIERLRDEMERRLGYALEDYTFDYSSIHDGEHIGVQKQKQDDYYYICAPVIAGILSSEKMVDVAKMAEDYGSGKVRLTTSQNFIIIDVPEDKVNVTLECLKNIGFPVEGSSIRWTTVACPSNFCGKTRSPNPKEIALEIVEYLEKNIGKALMDLNLSIGISGCPFSCAEFRVSEIGLEGVLVGNENEAKQCYNIYLGGSSGPNPSLGKLIKRNLDVETVKRAIKAILSNYLDKRKGSESFRDFCDRHNLEELESFMGLSEVHSKDIVERNPSGTGQGC